MSNRDGKHSKLKQKLFADFPKWFRKINGLNTFKRWFPKGNSTHPYDWDYYDSKDMKIKYLKKKKEENFSVDEQLDQE